MNILNGGMPSQNGGLPPQIMQGIAQIKQMRSMFGGNPQQMLQQMAQSNPAVTQIMQMCKGQNPQQILATMCQQRGIDMNALLRELQK